jgi:transcriptional regulator with XRE-family HTH domain
LLHLTDNLKLIRALLKQTQAEFIKNFTGKITVDMQKSYEGGKAKPDILYIQELAEMTGVSERELTSKKLSKSDFKAMRKVEKAENGEKKAANYSTLELLAADDFKKFRGLVVAKLSSIEANLKVLNNKFAEINKEVTGAPTTTTLTELEQTTKGVAKMLQEELEKMFP